MRRRAKRDDDEFARLKVEEFNKVNEYNAHKMLEDAKNKVMKKLQKLDVWNITEVENLYLIVAQLTQAAAFVAAINKAERKQTSVVQEIQGIALDDIIPILLNAFKDHPQARNLHKISIIDAVYKPDNQSWAALHGRMQIIESATKTHMIISVLTQTLPAYKQHLEYKLKQNGLDIPLPEKIPPETSVMIKKMLIRYQAVSELIAQKFENRERLTDADMEFMKEKITICLDNKPYWSERSFLQKLIDILSMGIRPLYRAFFSKEDGFQKALEQSIATPKMGG